MEGQHQLTSVVDAVAVGHVDDEACGGASVLHGRLHPARAAVDGGHLQRRSHKGQGGQGGAPVINTQDTGPSSCAKTYQSTDNPDTAHWCLMRPFILVHFTHPSTKSRMSRHLV